MFKKLVTLIRTTHSNQAREKTISKLLTKSNTSEYTLAKSVKRCLIEKTLSVENTFYIVRFVDVFYLVLIL